jgi:hypothetical protein
MLEGMPRVGAAGKASVNGASAACAASGVERMLRI